jgi:hypothetical protein
VKARLAWLAGGIGVGVAAAYRALRSQPSQAPPVEERPDPRADELRQKLAEARAAVDEREEFEAGETPVDEAPDPEPAAEPSVRASGPVEGVSGEQGGSPAPAEPLDERRRRVHERAKASARKMRSRDPEG